MRLLSYYFLSAPRVFIYMFQQVEYDPTKFLKWIFKMPDIRKVQRRKTLHNTFRAQGMLLFAFSTWLIPLVGGVFLAITTRNPLHLIVSLLSPLICILSLFICTLLMQRFIVRPVSDREIHKAQRKLSEFSVIRIAVLGSYGKTTMKELLKTVLSVGKNVAATPGNKNILISHARWIDEELIGNEDVLIFEYGEAAPGDIKKLATFSKPDIAVITGLAPAHMDAYPNLDAIADDLASIQEFVRPEKLYLNESAESIKARVVGNFYGQYGLDGHKVSDVQIGYGGTTFTLDHKGKKLRLESGLLGRHQIGPLCAVVSIAFQLGLNEKQVIEGVSRTVSFEHRMQPYNIGAAWIIDDSYNGNLEGVKAGLGLLRELPAKRKIYVTPGLVDQGSEKERTHVEIGRLIAKARPDKVILMRNSTTSYIQKGLIIDNYNGEVQIESDPLNFYQNVEHIVAGGDLLMMQNDWTDNYF